MIKLLTFHDLPASWERNIATIRPNRPRAPAKISMINILINVPFCAESTLTVIDPITPTAIPLTRFETPTATPPQKQA